MRVTSPFLCHKCNRWQDICKHYFVGSSVDQIYCLVLIKCSIYFDDQSDNQHSLMLLQQSWNGMQQTHIGLEQMGQQFLSFNFKMTFMSKKRTISKCRTIMYSWLSRLLSAYSWFSGTWHTFSWIVSQLLLVWSGFWSTFSIFKVYWILILFSLDFYLR